MNDRAIERALSLAWMNTHNKKLGCVALNGRGHIISEAQNSRTKTHPKQYHYAKKAQCPSRVFLHAEMRAIILAKQQIDELIVCRYDKRGNLCNSKPCEICQLAIEEAEISRVWYTNDRGEWEEWICM